MLIRKTLYTTRSGLLELPEPVPQAIIKAYNIIIAKSTPLYVHVNPHMCQTHIHSSAII